MERKYWEQFMKSGDVSDYLGYKMEVYGHCVDWKEQDREEQVESDRIDRNGAFNSADWRI